MEIRLKIVAIVQARMGSTRLPNKVMLPIGGLPLIEILLLRLSRSIELDQIILATSTDDRDDVLAEHVKSIGFACIRGSPNDVLERFIVAARTHEADAVVRITGDCPLIDLS
jgi:glutamate-1-semialdehyde 2,1-aminomutase